MSTNGVTSRSAIVRPRGFEGTDLRFSFYFPPAEQYRRRFFQPILASPAMRTRSGPATSAGWVARSASPLTAVATWWSRIWAGSRVPGRRLDGHWLPGQCRGGRVLEDPRGRHVRRAPSVRVLLRRQRGRLQDYGLLGEHRGLGRRCAFVIVALSRCQMCSLVQAPRHAILWHKFPRSWTRSTLGGSATCTPA